MTTLQNDSISSSWSLPSTMCNKSIFDGKAMKEYANVKKLYQFIKEERGITYPGIDRYAHLSWNNELEQMKDYRDLYDNEKECFKTSYKFPSHGWGRINPKSNLSLGTFHRPTRHTYCNNIYVDIDMCNAMPTYVNAICKLMGVPSESIG